MINYRQRLFVLPVLMALFILLVCSNAYSRETKNVYYAIHIASFKRLDSCRGLITSLKKKGYSPFYKAVDIPGKGKWFRLFVGNYENKKKALVAADRLRSTEVIGDFDIQEIQKPVDYSRSKHISKPKKPATVRKVPDEKPDAGEKVFSDRKSPSPDQKKIAHYPNHAGSVSINNKITIKDISLYKKAMGDFDSGNYANALKKFNEVKKLDNLSPGEKEKILRRSADCRYFLGKDGNNQYLFNAIEQYKSAVQKYPNSKKENALALYRTAKCYEHLKFYYEAVNELKNLCSIYPESEYVDESLYMMGESYYKVRKFKESVGEFQTYIERYPDGEYIKDAYFRVGDSYSQMNQFDNADHWYGKALKRWPDLEDIPKDELLKLGNHYFRGGSYEHALEPFFVYINLYPEDQSVKDVLSKIARSFIGTNQLSLGLEMLSLVIEKYPESREAKESAIIMANIGIKSPDIKLPRYIFCGIEHYAKPIETYDNMIEKIAEPVMKEDLLFQKGCAFLERKSYADAFNTFYSLLKRFPYGKNKKSGQKNLLLSANYRIDQYFSEGDYVAVSDIYFKIRKIVPLADSNIEMLSAIGTSLKKMGLLNCAASVFEKISEISPTNGEKETILLALAQVKYEQGQYEKAEKGVRKLLRKKPAKDESVFINARKLMGNIYYKIGLFEKAARSYSEVFSSGKKIDGIGILYKRYADSLKAMGFSQSAFINYRKGMISCNEKDKKCSVPVVTGCYEGLGDCLYDKGKFKEGISMYKKTLVYLPESNHRLWILYNIGVGYLNLGNKTMADRTFNSLKEKGDEEYWASVVDYRMDDKNWTEKFSRYLTMN